MDKNRNPVAAANACGVSVAEYLKKRRRNQHWCWKCRKFHPASAFGKDRSRSSGLLPFCKESRKR